MARITGGVGAGGRVYLERAWINTPLVAGRVEATRPLDPPS